MTLIDPLELLPSTDKWQLGAGGTLYAPQHPQHLHVPGFWDEVLVGGKAFSKLLCVSFVLEKDVRGDDVGATRASPAVDEPDCVSGDARVAPTTKVLIELDPYLSYWYWYPDRIEARYYLVVREGIGYKQQAGIRVFMNEVRRILPDGSLQCEISFDLLKQHPPRLHVVAWGMNSQLSSQAGLAVTSTARALRREPVVPLLRFTPFWEMLHSGHLSGEAAPEGGALQALHWIVNFGADEPQTLQVSCAPPDPEAR